MVRYILSICLLFALLLTSDAKGYLVGFGDDGELLDFGAKGD